MEGGKKGITEFIETGFWNMRNDLFWSFLVVTINKVEGHNETEPRGSKVNYVGEGLGLECLSGDSF